MTHTTLKRLAGASVIGAILALAACGDGAPTASLKSPGSAMFGVIPSGNPPAFSTPGQVDLEFLEICKQYPAGVTGPSVTFDIDVTGGTTQSFEVTLAGGQCREVWVNGGGAADNVTVTEQVPAGFAASYVKTTRVQGGSPVTGASVASNVATATIGGPGIPGALIVFTNTPLSPPPSTGNKGCTPGYWKQTHHFDSWPAAYNPDDSFNQAFGIGTKWFANSLSLDDALGQGGGGAKALGRHAAAALLNAASGFYPLTVDQVIAAVQAAYNNNSLVESTKNILANNNERGCPLN